VPRETRFRCLDIWAHATTSAWCTAMRRHRPRIGSGGPGAGAIEVSRGSGRTSKKVFDAPKIMCHQLRSVSRHLVRRDKPARCSDGSNRTVKASEPHRPRVLGGLS